MNAPHLTRRDFATALGGIVLSFSLAPKLSLAQQPPRLPGSLATNKMLDAWIRIAADGGVTVFTGKVELGQGMITALAQIAAEELDVPFAARDHGSGRHRSHAGRGPNRRQPVDREQRHGAAHGRRGSARDAALISPRKSSALPPMRSK